jgi:hypothetical protein
MLEPERGYLMLGVLIWPRIRTRRPSRPVRLIRLIRGRSAWFR